MLTLIQSQTLAAPAASVTFSSIPGTHKTLMVKVSARGASTTAACTITLNSSSANFTTRYAKGSGSAVTSASTSAGDIGDVSISTDTANAFGSMEITIVDYAGADNKAFSVDVVTENDATAAVQQVWGCLWANTAAVTSLALANAANFDTGSTFSLYGIS